MTTLGAAHAAGTWIGIALYAGLAAAALWWAVRLADAPPPSPPPEGAPAGSPPPARAR